MPDAATQTMQAVCATREGGPEALHLDQLPVPAAGTGDVLVAVHAAGYTPTELTWASTWVDRSGHERLPVVPGHEVSGVVAALGFGATGFAVGDRVFGLTDWYRDGAAAEWVAVEARNLAVLPAGLEHPTAAGTALAGLTAWQGLFRHARVRAGSAVLVTGAAGGVGNLALQLALDAGASVTAVAHARDHEALRDLGAQRVGELEGALGDGPFDVVFDTVGGDTLARACTRVREGGTVVSVAAPPPPELLAPGRLSGGYFVVEPDRAESARLAALLAAGSLRPLLGHVADLSDGVEAIAAKEDGRTRGKLVLRVAHPAAA